jgi:hypothetical protein
VAAGEAAPYGQGMDTVYDPSVRRATQITPSLVTPSNAWSRALEDITQTVTEQLGVQVGWLGRMRAGQWSMTCLHSVLKFNTYLRVGLLQGCSVQAHLYKVLVYGPGGHFVPHRDTGDRGNTSAGWYWHQADRCWRVWSVSRRHGAWKGAACSGNGRPQHSCRKLTWQSP